MKRLFVLIAVALVCGYTFAQSEVSDSTVQKSSKKSYAFYKGFSHWSLAVSGGFNLLLSERDQNVGEKIMNYKDNFLGQFNFEAEYSINPIWGVALNYAYAPYSKNSIFSDQYPGAHPEKHGQGHQVYAVMNINLLNLFSRYRTHTEWGWYFGTGLGIFAYNGCVELITEGKTDTWSVVPMFPFETQVDYSPIPSLSIFLKTSLGVYLRDNVNVAEAGPLNDWNLYGGLGLRWNINADKKPHVRNVDMATYQKSAENRNDDCTDTAAQNRIKKLEQQLKDMQNMMKANMCCDDVKNVKKHADTNTEEIDKLRAMIDSLKQNTQINTEIADNSVYFGNNSWEIDAKYQAVVEKIARIMMAYPQLNVEITAFCSKIGNPEKNKIVGDRRIAAVKDLLVNKYKIDENRISSSYSGQVFEGLESENRRCDLRLHQ